MKFLKFLAVLSCFFPIVSFGAGSSDFQNASQLLMAARSGDTQTVQFLVSSGADINYTDSTGLSLVCTAVMNNDRRAIQILQMYGADASQCDKQIKKYKQRSKVAAKGEDYNFFSGLSSSHVIVLSAVAVAGVIGGVALLTDAFKAKNGNHNSPSGGSHSGGGGESGGGSATKEITIPYGPAYLTSEGKVDTSFDITQNLSDWDTNSNSLLRKADFNYLRNTEVDGNVKVSPATLEGLNSMLQNYLLVMGGYYSLASGYMGQHTFRDESRAPVISETGYQGQPIVVALITGNGINPAGSADSGDGITYAKSTSLNAETKTVDKYVNNILNNGVAVEKNGFDFSGSGSAFNPFVDVNDSALAKIVAGWEGYDRTYADLYGFVPNGQLAIFRTGNGKTWSNLSTDKRENVGSFTDADDNGKLSSGDTIIIKGVSYKIVSALSETLITNPTVKVNGTTYKLAAKSKMFVGKCVNTTNCENIAIYVGTDTDETWYVNSTGKNDIDAVYQPSGTSIYTSKKLTDDVYRNFEAISAAVGLDVNDNGNAVNNLVVANTNVINASRNINYTNTKTFKSAASAAGNSDLVDFYSDSIDSYYGKGQGVIANTLFGKYSSASTTLKPLLVMPAGDYIYKEEATGIINFETQDATFENYAPMLYGNNLKHNFMTVVAVSHSNGTSDASTITGYGDGTGSGKLVLSLWQDSDSENIYRSRKCGISGSGVAASGIDPWCFAASGPTAEMATASAAGAVASVKSAFDYMTNDQIFTLLALTADGPWLSATTDGTVLTTDTLAEYLKAKYELPLEYDVDSATSSEYLNMFKDVYGYGLINLERAIKPGYSLYYYDGTSGNIVSTTGTKNKFWGNVVTTSSRASSVLALSGRSAVKTSYYDVLQSTDGSLSLPRVWSDTIAFDNTSKHGLYMGDVLGDFNVDNSNKHTNKIGNLTFDMSMSDRAYNDKFNGLDNLRVAFTNDKLDIDAQYQHYLTCGESRFDGRANNLLALNSNAVSSGAAYKVGKFSFGSNAFFGSITEESLLETDPVVSNQFEPGRLGFANGVSFDAKYNNDKFGLDVSFGTMHENNTVLGSLSSGLLALNGADTQYVDVVSVYKPMEKVKLSLRGTFANTKANVGDGIISELSNIKSNAFAFGADVGGFSFTAAMPLATVSGRMGYGYADFNVVENDGEYSVVMENAHTEYIDLSHNKRELRFTTNYKRSVGQFTDAGLGFIYRVNPNNTDAFGNESVFMFKIHHRLGI